MVNPFDRLEARKTLNGMAVVPMRDSTSTSAPPGIPGTNPPKMSAASAPIVPAERPKTTVISSTTTPRPVEIESTSPHTSRP
jgi:hypothetical protein